MNVNDRLDKWLPQLKEAKESIVRDFPDDPDAPSMVEIYREDKPVCAMLFMPNMDLMLLLVKFGIIGMEADMVGFSTETIATQHVVNPGTGKPWGPFEAQQVLRDHPEYWFDGLVEESLLTTVWARNGDAVQSLDTFEVNGKEVIWKESKRLDSPMQGPATEQITMFWHDETMAEAANRATSGEHPDLTRLPRSFLDAVKTEIEGMSTVERQVRQDIATLLYLREVLTKVGAQVAFSLSAESDSERAKLLAVRAPAAGLHYSPIV